MSVKDDYSELFNSIFGELGESSSPSSPPVEIEYIPQVKRIDLSTEEGQELYNSIIHQEFKGEVLRLWEEKKFVDDKLIIYKAYVIVKKKIKED